MRKPTFNSQVTRLSPPPIPRVQQWANQYQGSHGPLLDLSQAVPGHPPEPVLLQQLGESAANPNYAHYGPIEGEIALRDVYAQHLTELYQSDFSAPNIHITSGCNQAFIATTMSIAKAGDSILVCNPFYFNHQSTLAMLGIDIVYSRTTAEQGFLPDPSDLAKTIDDKVRAILLISPNNPTGAIYPDALLKEILALCQQRGIWLILDETYRDFLTTQNTRPHDLFTQDHWQNNLIQLYSFSKSYCIPGHRLGAVCAAPKLIEELAKVMDNIQICAPRPSQIALSLSIPRLSDWREGNRQIIEQRSEKLQYIMQQLPDWNISAIGAYFAFIQHPFACDSTTVAKALAEQRGLLSLPGDFFGAGNEDHLRIAFANVEADSLSMLLDKLANTEALELSE